MSERQFDPTDTCGLCAVGELGLEGTEAEDAYVMVLSLATGGLEEDQVASDLSGDPEKQAAVLSCGNAIKNGLCLKYANLNPGGGYDG